MYPPTNTLVGVRNSSSGEARHSLYVSLAGGASFELGSWLTKGMDTKRVYMFEPHIYVIPYFCIVDMDDEDNYK